MNYRDFLEYRGVDTFDGAGSSDFLINCPFHDDNHPSLEVHRHNGVYYCFGCKATGSFPMLLSEIENIPLLDAKKIMMTVDNADSVVSDISEMLSSFDEEEKVMKYYSVESFHKNFPSLQENSRGLKYIINRGIDSEYSEWFDLRWGGSNRKWRDRVIIPIYTAEGKLLTYAGRTIVPKVMPKTRKIKGRSPRSSLYGLFNLFEYHGIKKFPALIVVEGEFDAEYLQTFGLPAVSTMGTMGLTGEQIYLLKKHSQVVVFSYDGDDAGRKAQSRGIAKVRGYQPTIGIDLPDKHDPNELSPEQVAKIYRGYFL
jgi:DNA primase